MRACLPLAVRRHCWKQAAEACSRKAPSCPWRWLLLALGRERGGLLLGIALAKENVMIVIIIIVVNVIIIIVVVALAIIAIDVVFVAIIIVIIVAVVIIIVAIVAHVVVASPRDQGDPV